MMSFVNPAKFNEILFSLRLPENISIIYPFIYFLFLVIDLSKKDFHELERLEYQKRFISEYGKPELSNCNSFNRAKPC